MSFSRYYRVYLFANSRTLEQNRHRHLHVAKDATSTVSTTRPLSQVPSPPGALPVLGHLLKIKNRPGNLSEFYDELFDTFGPIYRLKLPGMNLICISDPNAVEAVVRNEGQYPVRTPAGFKIKWFYDRKSLPTPFVFLSGEPWRKLRSNHGKQQMPQNVYNYIPGFTRMAARLVDHMLRRANNDGYVKDVHTLVLNWSMEVAAYFAMGVELDIGSNATPEDIRFQNAIRNLTSLIEDFIVAPPFYKIYPTKLYRELDKATNDLYGIGKKYAMMQKDNNTGVSCLEQWLAEGKMTTDEIIMSTIFIMGAGVDNTPSTASFALYELSRNPNIQDKLRQQILEVLGETQELTGQNIQQLPYLSNVIKEILRMYSIAPIHYRTIPIDLDILGYNIPAKTLVAYSNYTVTKNEKYFKNPSIFDPERWDHDAIHPFANLPWGVGPKGCWGRRFAEVVLKTFLIKMCREFVFTSDESPHKKLQTSERTFMRPDAPICIKLTKRT